MATWPGGGRSYSIYGSPMRWHWPPLTTTGSHRCCPGRISGPPMRYPGHSQQHQRATDAGRPDVSGYLSASRPPKSQKGTFSTLTRGAWCVRRASRLRIPAPCRTNGGATAPAPCRRGASRLRGYPSVVPTQGFAAREPPPRRPDRSRAPAPPEPPDRSRAPAPPNPPIGAEAPRPPSRLRAAQSAGVVARPPARDA